MRGEAQKIDFKRAKMWFERGAEMVSPWKRERREEEGEEEKLTRVWVWIGQGERESYNGLGIIYRDGLGVSVDGVKAQEFFQAAADQDLAEAHVNLGKLALGSFRPFLSSLRLRLLRLRI